MVADDLAVGAKPSATIVMIIWLGCDTLCDTYHAEVVKHIIQCTLDTSRYLFSQELRKDVP